MPYARKPVAKDIAFTLSKTTDSYRVVSVLQEMFKTPETTKDGKTTAARKLQGRLVIDAVLETVMQYASPATLEALASDAKNKGEGDKKGKASEFITAIIDARSVSVSPTTPKSVNDLTDEELEAEIARRAAAKAASPKMKNVAAI